MNRIKIHNIGPIKDVTLDLNKVNVIMGPQSSGKSTIAKIASYCQWVEKRFILDGEFKENFIKKLMSFHRLSDTYFNENSFFSYESNSIKISYSEKDKNNPQIELINNGLEFLNSKNIYIPAERNFVSAIPNLGRYKETNDNIMNFLYDWYEIKKKFDKTNSLSLLDLGVSYYHIEKTDSDNLILKNNEELSLNNASSGLQSIAPLLLFINYLTKDLYIEEKMKSAFEIENEEKTLEEIFSQISKGFLTFEEYRKKTKIEINDMKSVIKLLGSYYLKNQYQFSQLIIEEPEQNLFPKTQRDLIYYMLQAINDIERDHKLLITTHSPYILYALNNCMMGYSVKTEMPKNEQNELPSSNSWINPVLVSVWEIEGGKLRDIKDKGTKTVSKHYFNRIMNEVMDEYYDMLNYFDA